MSATRARRLYVHLVVDAASTQRTTPGRSRFVSAWNLSLERRVISSVRITSDGDGGTDFGSLDDQGPRTLSDLYRSRRLAMLRLATVMTGSSTTAEELVQEAFLRLHERWDKVDNPGAFLRVVVTNLAIGHLRRLRIERDHAPAAGALAVGNPDIDETWAAVCELPARQRAVLALRFYEDLTEAQIADVLGCRPGTVKSSLHRGLARLRKELA